MDLIRRRRNSAPVALQLSPHLAGAVDGVVRLVDAGDLGFQSFVAKLPGRRGPAEVSVVGGRGDGQDGTHRLDPEILLVLGDKRGHLFCLRSSSAPKEAAAAFKISLARLSSRFSRSSSLMRTHLRSVYGVMPNLDATELMAAH